MDDDHWFGWPERWVGTDCAVRTAVGAILREVKNGFRYDEVPWRRFPHFYGPGEEIPGLLATLRNRRRRSRRQGLAAARPCSSSGRIFTTKAARSR
ncbi:hypothetical protein GCM10011578_053940 [Streptomyces fuscichromogenes]|uniref:Uncharacterized protein n=1 Tax=Streptomyces fuscichromogenes TaxID=1324013 RepID=A0A917XHC8_9ACTN|nr:hypothetical protein GCM10011578_053940 [Streptomyces fuscichromogenes]